MQDQDKLAHVELTAAERAQEQALRSLRPAPARIDVAAAALEAARRASRRQRHAWQAAAAAVLATAIAWLAFAPRGNAPELARHQTPAGAPPAAPPAAVEPTMLLAYHWALMRSPEELEALFDRQAAAGVGRNRQPIPAGTLRSWDANLQATLKEM